MPVTGEGMRCKCLGSDEESWTTIFSALFEQFTAHCVADQRHQNQIYPLENPPDTACPLIGQQLILHPVIE